ncbi:MAG: L,D-transpeptidase family protein, partial [Bdellovibrio sp.]|nr:L,D-transpeptidase family protein [Bdellovibrio sp.]
MKKVVLLIAMLSGSAAGAESRAYCDTIDRIYSRPFLNSSQFANFVADGSKIDRIVINKQRRWMYILKEDVVIKAYRIALGKNPIGAKQFAGDYKTPEGTYTIDGKNLQSEFYKSLHVSYPNAKDVAYARLHGRSPGGLIMIHGFPVSPSAHRSVQQTHPTLDWTAGCIAVTDREIDEIFSLTKTGTTVEICKTK